MTFQKLLKKFVFTNLLSILFFSMLSAEESSPQKGECPSFLLEPKEGSTLGEMRSKSLKNWDKMLTWAFSKKKSSYILANPSHEETFHVTDKEIFVFDRNHGYFSPENPIVAKSTASVEDIWITECILKLLQEKIKNKQQRDFSTWEICCKILAYRALEKGMEISIGETYTVDEIINLWHGMPAFGLLPKNPKSTPILLFRGTDLIFSKERGWASVLSDLDITGPGLSTFMQARPQIRKWLTKVSELGTPARVMGVSLGGVFAGYTYIFENSLLSSSEPSIALNPPGVSADIFKKWEIVSKKAGAPLHVFVTRGDFVSKIGYLIGSVKEASVPYHLRVIQAHVILLSAQKEFSFNDVDLTAENKSRKNHYRDLEAR